MRAVDLGRARRENEDDRMVDAERVLLEAARARAEDAPPKRAREEHVEPRAIVLDPDAEARGDTPVARAAREPRVQLVHLLGVRDLLRRGLDVFEGDFHGSAEGPTT